MMTLRFEQGDAFSRYRTVSLRHEPGRRCERGGPALCVSSARVKSIRMGSEVVSRRVNLEGRFLPVTLPYLDRGKSSRRILTVRFRIVTMSSGACMYSCFCVADGVERLFLQ